MGVRLFSDKKRAVHLGPFPLERLSRGEIPDLSAVPEDREVVFASDTPESLLNAMRDYQAMMDAIRDGLVNRTKSKIPDDIAERSRHLKAFCYFNDASMVGIGALPDSARRATAIKNPEIDRLSYDLSTKQTKTLASGIDMIMADLKESMSAPSTDIDTHSSALVILNEAPRAPWQDEPGSGWLSGASLPAAALRASETAVVLANYIRLLGWEARAHAVTSSDVHLGRLGVAAGLLTLESGGLEAPYLGESYGLAAVTTSMPLEHDATLLPKAMQSWARTHGPNWWLGTSGARRSGVNGDPFRKRAFHLGPHPFETLKRVESPTTYIDEPNVARVPKRTDMFARAQFGDMGPALQNGAKGGHYVRKAAPSSAQRRLLGAFVLLQDGPAKPQRLQSDAAKNALAIKAASYFLGIDAVGISRCPEWAWYSHDATGAPIEPPHDQAISMIVDQGHETMEGASGDDWISVAQSMRAYLRFSLLGGIIAAQIRNLGYSAKAHTVMDGEVLQPPLLLLSGLGEVSRIGEVILNPFLGPRLKSGVVTTDMPLAHDMPIDFGMQSFCEACNKCARECPSGAITAGPKLMFNGYEIWKSDSQKCATYRITTEGGAMCGRCMKTCPWNLEGLFAEKPFRWAAMNLPKSAPALAKLDDMVGKGRLNPAKKWWWDLELSNDGAYRPTAKPVNARDIQPDLEVNYEDQTLAVYPANLAPHPWPYPYAMDREAGIEAYQALVTAEEYQRRKDGGDESHIHRYAVAGESPVLRVVCSKAEQMSPDVTKYEFRNVDGKDLPVWEAGAHLDIVVAPEFLRQYSMSGDPADRKVYQIGVLREDHGRGGSALLHRIFSEGRKVFISRPINHFPLVEDAEMTFLMGGGIGITPMIAMAHRLHALGRPFEVHYSVSSRENAGFLADLDAARWRENVALHISDAGSRADFSQLLNKYRQGSHVYTCGPDRYMAAVLDAAERAGFPEGARHLEYFSVPEVPDYKNHPFSIRLVKSGKQLHVPADKTASDVLIANGIPIDLKCSDGLCGVCACGLVSGDVEHRDFVLSRAQRETRFITCQSRATDANGIVELDL
ncbi:2Fe-2S iron-sulfur cluster-binding protein [Boseongicola aestuarii]|uniref:3-chloro-4-hydroxyphenylacetate reductive dehalogenase n=1 Tax=Boseongicola aestuarii TaxID=1470561 RepID=A0A238J0G1_9RHOB|nr:2Fe-2S iron-sulfur cluster-binding protein [Boseongicola aestuarii]SMX23470.1 3-chloro-4-hydroxyphenylacetate reductive dehalogenase precursor [Boseongicola aestuarii]